MRRLSYLALCIIALASAVFAEVKTSVPFSRTEDVVYGRKFGTALTFDVFRPEKPNGASVLFMVSGGFSSNHARIDVKNYQLFLEHGYTVFAIVHGSQPRYIVTEIVEDIHRAVRFIRTNAARFGVDPNKFGITGTSSGGHLSLIMGLRGGPGHANAKDPVDRESSAVQAVACFCPPTDFVNWGGPGDDQLSIGPVGSRFKSAWGPKAETAEGRQAISREVSPIHFVSAKMAPTLVLHGDADKTVPFYQARIFEQKCAAAGAVYKLVVREGKDHGWPEMATDRAQFVAWFDKYLLGK